MIMIIMIVINKNNDNDNTSVKHKVTSKHDITTIIQQLL